MTTDAADLMVDTNVLAAQTSAADPMNGVTLAALTASRCRRRRLVVTAQVIIEFYRVCTRPSSERGSGMTPAQAAREREIVLRAFELLPETAGIFLA